MSNQPRREPPSASPTAQHHRRALMRAHTRGVITIMLFVTWFMVALTGFLLYLVPRGQELLFLTRRECGEIHFWFAAAAVIVTVTHLIVNWKAVKSSVRSLLSTRRGHAPHKSNEPRREPSPASPAAQHHRRTLMRAHTRGVITIMLFVTWFMVALTGFPLYLAPAGQGSGGQLVLPLLTRRECGEVHFWFAAVAVIVTVTHLIVDWKAVKSSVRSLVRTRRGHTPHK